MTWDREDIEAVHHYMWLRTLDLLYDQDGRLMGFCRPVPATFLAANPTHTCTCWRH